jgi:uncharacterized membrane protein YeaQ/YmgE (transglycosylase-associated protein family)
MDILLLIILMVIVGLIIGWVAGLIWKDNRPIGVRGDYVVAVISAVLIGLLDWFVIPAIISNEMIKYIGVAIEPALGALLILWLIRVAKRQ